MSVVGSFPCSLARVGRGLEDRREGRQIAHRFADDSPGDDALLRDDEGRGHGEIRACVGDSERGDDPSSRIGEHVELDVQITGELCRVFEGVGADGCDRSVDRVELILGPSQLTELATCEGSAVSSVEDENGWPSFGQSGQRHLLSRLIRQAELRRRSGLSEGCRRGPDRPAGHDEKGW